MFDESLHTLNYLIEDAHFAQHLSEDTGIAPHVNGGRVVCATQQDLWRTVPQRHNLRGEARFKRVKQNHDRAELCTAWLRPEIGHSWT